MRRLRLPGAHRRALRNIERMEREMFPEHYKEPTQTSALLQKYYASTAHNWVDVQRQQMEAVEASYKGLGAKVAKVAAGCGLGGPSATYETVGNLGLSAVQMLPVAKCGCGSEQTKTDFHRDFNGPPVLRTYCLVCKRRLITKLPWSGAMYSAPQDYVRAIRQEAEKHYLTFQTPPDASATETILAHVEATLR